MAEFHRSDLYLSGARQDRMASNCRTCLQPFSRLNGRGLRNLCDPEAGDGGLSVAHHTDAPLVPIEIGPQVGARLPQREYGSGFMGAVCAIFVIPRREMAAYR